MWIKFDSHCFTYLSRTCRLASIFNLDSFIFSLIFVWRFFLLFSIMLRVFYFFLFLLHGFLVLLLFPLDDKAVTDVTGLCQNGCSDTENWKCWCVPMHQKLSVLFASTYTMWLSKRDHFPHFPFIIWCLIELP